MRDLAVLTSVERVVPDVCAGCSVPVDIAVLISEEQSGAVNVGISVTPSAHSVQQLRASQLM